MRKRPACILFVAASPLLETGATEPLEIMLEISLEFERHPTRDPGEGDIGLGAPQGAQSCSRRIGLSGHPRRRRENAVGAGEVGPKADGPASELHRLHVVASGELGVIVLDCCSLADATARSCDGAGFNNASHR